jgi:hypothetical protein
LTAVWLNSYSPAHEKAIAQAEETYAEAKEIQDYALPASGTLEGHQDPGD